jgi:hypothetical protein
MFTFVYKKKGVSHIHPTIPRNPSHHSYRSHTHYCCHHSYYNGQCSKKETKISVEKDLPNKTGDRKYTIYTYNIYIRR